MKIATLSIQQFVAAVIIAIALSFALSPSPAPVSYPVIEVTPVPTPAPVYITVEPTQHIEPQQTMVKSGEENTETVVTEMSEIMFAFMIHPIFILVIFLPVVFMMFRVIQDLDIQ